MAEVASYLRDLSPLPRSRELSIATLTMSASKVVTLDYAKLLEIGVSREHYGTRDYGLTQQIGATLEWLGFDGLISPSARYNCNNLTLFTRNHQLDERLEIVSQQSIEWRAWARERGWLDGLE